MIVFNDVVQNPEQQSRKKRSKDKTSLPDESNTLVHGAEVLRQVETSGLEKNDWVGGDAWFGSVSSCAELKKRVITHFIPARFLLPNMFPLILT